MKIVVGRAKVRKKINCWFFCSVQYSFVKTQIRERPCSEGKRKKKRKKKEKRKRKKKTKTKTAEFPIESRDYTWNKFDGKWKDGVKIKNTKGSITEQEGKKRK